MRSLTQFLALAWVALSASAADKPAVHLRTVQIGNVVTVAVPTGWRLTVAQLPLDQDVNAPNLVSPFDGSWLSRSTDPKSFYVLLNASNAPLGEDSTQSMEITFGKFAVRSEENLRDVHAHSESLTSERGKRIAELLQGFKDFRMLHVSRILRPTIACEWHAYSYRFQELAIETHEVLCPTPDGTIKVQLWNSLPKSEQVTVLTEEILGSLRR